MQSENKFYENSYCHVLENRHIDFYGRNRNKDMKTRNKDMKTRNKEYVSRKRWTKNMSIKNEILKVVTEKHLKDGIFVIYTDLNAAYVKRTNDGISIVDINYDNGSYWVDEYYCDETINFMYLYEMPDILRKCEFLCDDSFDRYVDDIITCVSTISTSTPNRISTILWSAKDEKKNKDAVINNEIKNKNDDKKGEIKMDNKKGLMSKMMENFMPEAIENGEVGITMNGNICVKRKDGCFVTYNSETKTIENQMDFVINGDEISNMIMLTPTAVTALKNGDIIKDNECYLYVETISKNNDINTINLSNGTTRNKKNETNILTGNKMYKKIVSLMDMSNGNNPMGGMNPMMLMMMSKDKDSGSSNMMEMMLMSQMMGNQSGNPSSSGGINPMMLMMMNKDKDSSSSNMMEMMMMQSMMGGNSAFPNMFGQQSSLPDTGKSK